MTDLSISIATTNHCGMVRDCLNSIYEGTRSISFEIFVIDSGSVDGTIEMLASEFPEVNVIRNERFPGFSAAHNQAIALSAGRYVMVLNDDTIVASGALAGMVAFMDAHPEAGALGPYLANRDGTHQISSYVAFPTLWSECFTRAAPLSWIWSRRRQRLETNTDYFDQYGRYNGNPVATRRVKHLMGACILLRHSVIRDVGLLDPGFFLSYEDQDWCKRIDDAGWHLVYFPESKVVHFGSETVRNVEQFGKIFLESRYRFERKHGSRFSAFLVRPMFISIGVLNRVWHTMLLARRRVITAVRSS